MTQEAAESFYPPHVKEILSRPEMIKSGNSWQGFMDFLTSGPLTYFILWDSTESGNAITRWREIIGATDPQTAKPGTIRGNYANSKQANLVHGSGDPEEAKREIDWLKNLIKNTIIQNKYGRKRSD